MRKWQKTCPVLNPTSPSSESLGILLKANKGIILGAFHTDHSFKEYLVSVLTELKKDKDNNLHTLYYEAGGVLPQELEKFNNGEVNTLFKESQLENIAPGICERDNKIARTARNLGIKIVIFDSLSGASEKLRRLLLDSPNIPLPEKELQARKAAAEEKWMQTIEENEKAKPDSERFIAYMGLYHARDFANKIGVPSAMPDRHREDPAAGADYRLTDIPAVEQPMAYENLVKQYRTFEDTLFKIAHTKQGYSWYTVLEEMPPDNIKRLMGFLGEIDAAQLRNCLSAVSEKNMKTFAIEVSNADLSKNQVESLVNYPEVKGNANVACVILPVIGSDPNANEQTHALLLDADLVKESTDVANAVLPVIGANRRATNQTLQRLINHRKVRENANVAERVFGIVGENPNANEQTHALLLNNDLVRDNANVATSALLGVTDNENSTSNSLDLVVTKLDSALLATNANLQSIVRCTVVDHRNVGYRTLVGMKNHPEKAVRDAVKRRQKEALSNLKDRSKSKFNYYTSRVTIAANKVNPMPEARRRVDAKYFEIGR